MAVILIAILAISRPLSAQSQTALSQTAQSQIAQFRPSPSANFVAAEDSLENQPISAGIAPTSSRSATPSASPATFDVTRVLLALTAVVALIFVLMAAFKKIYPGAAPIRASAAVKVLARCPVSPKQHLLVVQFGKRLVLVGDTGVHLNPLCEISDPDEAAGILAQAREESVSVARRFDSFFGLARKTFSDATAPTEENFDDSSEIPAVDPSSPDSPADDPSLEATRKEIAGLADKVRNVSRQLGSA
jgi:flagellar biogenesis protein FliO